MDEAPSRTTGPVRESDAGAAAVPDDALCVGCGYMLCGLPPVGQCPECGLAVRWSLRADAAWHDHAFLRRLRLAAVVLMLAELLLLAAALTPGRASRDGAGGLLRLMLPGALACLSLAQALLVIAPQRGAAAPGSKWLARMMVGSAALAGASALLHAPWALRGSGGPLVVAVLALLATICLALSFVRVAGLASALVAPDLAATARGVGQTFIVCAAVALVVVAQASTGSFSSAGSLIVGVALSCAAMLAVVIAGVVGLGVLIELAFLASDGLRAGR